MTNSMQPYKSYVICTSPRSGSTLLCRLLAATGVAGNPDSHFHQPSLSRWLTSFDLSEDAYGSDLEKLEAVFAAAREFGTGETGIFGLRLQRKSFDYFSQQLKILCPDLPSDTARIKAAFGKTLFIHLTRADKLAQAVSFVKASQSGLWHKAPDGTELERLSEPKEPVYNAEEIAGHFRQMIAYEEEWANWFAQEKIDPLRITYDNLSANPEATLLRIFDRLGLNREAAKDVSLPVAKLSDNINQVWIERFRAEQETLPGVS